MSVWLVRAQANGQYENRFIQEGRIYLNWARLTQDLSSFENKDDLGTYIAQQYPEQSSKVVANWKGQIWPFIKEMAIGDLVVMPLKSQWAIQIGRITGEYQYMENTDPDFCHFHTVSWIETPVPRSHFSQDLLNSFGAFMSVCRIKRNNAEDRLLAMEASGWKPESTAMIIKAQNTTTDDNGDSTDDSFGDLIEKATDQINACISSQFKNHDLTRLIDAILRAQGYTTFVSPAGPDGGADIFAGKGDLGLGEPRLCVEVKSGDTPIGRPDVDKLLGAVTKFGANQGLFVSWGGYKSNVQKELAANFFQVRLWGQKEILENLFACYDHLDEDIKLKLPLKKTWVLSLPKTEAD